jgi:hypothetical protein
MLGFVSDMTAKYNFDKGKVSSIYTIRGDTRYFYPLKMVFGTLYLSL